MTTRSLAEVGIKLIGVYFGGGGVISLLALAASLGVPRVEGLPSSVTIVLLNAFAIAGQLAVSAACILRGKELVSRIFADDRPQLANVSRQDMLVVGVVLIGISTIVSATPAILQFIGSAIWYAQGSRQSQFLPSMEQSWLPLSNHMLELITGGVLVLMAGRLASALDRRYSRD